MIEEPPYQTRVAVIVHGTACDVPGVRRTHRIDVLSMESASTAGEKIPVTLMPSADSPTLFAKIIEPRLIGNPYHCYWECRGRDLVKMPLAIYGPDDAPAGPLYVPDKSAGYRNLIDPRTRMCIAAKVGWVAGLIERLIIEQWEISCPDALRRELEWVAETKQPWRMHQQPCLPVLIEALQCCS